MLQVDIFLLIEAFNELQCSLGYEGNTPGSLQLHWPAPFPNILVEECGPMQMDVTVRETVSTSTWEVEQRSDEMIHLEINRENTMHRLFVSHRSERWSRRGNSFRSIYAPMCESSQEVFQFGHRNQANPLSVLSDNH
jgi:hypothetical protein